MKEERQVGGGGVMGERMRGREQWKYHSTIFKILSYPHRDLFCLLARMQNLGPILMIILMVSFSVIFEHFSILF